MCLLHSLYSAVINVSFVGLTLGTKQTKYRYCKIHLISKQLTQVEDTTIG